MKTICALDLHPGLRASGGKNRIAVGPNNLWENQGLLILPPPLVPPLVAPLIPPFSKTPWYDLGTGKRV